MFKRLLQIKSAQSFILALLILICLGFNLFNIGYNSPSGDEAIFIKIGTDAVLNNRWGIYDITSTIGGNPYLYPTITAISYATYGINGSRILNVIFLVVGLYFVTKLANLLSKSMFAPIIAVTLIGFSEISYYVSRLATNEMPSFTFLIIGIYFLVKALKNSRGEVSAKNFLVSALLLYISFAMKYASLPYILLTAVFSYLYIQRKNNVILLKTWSIYFIIPLFIFLMLTIFPQISRVWSVPILTKNTYSILLFGLVGAITISKLLKNRISKIILVLALITYVLFSVNNTQKYNSLWPDHRSAQKFLSQNLDENDILLTEERSSLLTKARVTTFESDENTYLEALEDGYFSFVELNLGYSNKTQSYKELEEKILKKIEGNYFPIYQDTYYTIYQRGY